MSEKGSKLGMVIGWIVIASVCIALGWVGSTMWSGMVAKKMAAAMAARHAGGGDVTVATTNVQMRAYNLPERYVAHAEAMQEVDLLPQVDGYIKDVKFKEGDVVRQGQLLYELDDERYQAVVNQRKADLAAAEAEERRAKRYYERTKSADERGITQLERDNAEASAEQATAAVLQAKANLIVAEYDCNKAKVFAPIAGQIGKSNAYVGDYVAPSKGALAKIVQIDPIRVSFPMTDRAYVGWRQAVKKGNAPDYRMRLILPDGSDYDKEGAWDFDDNQMSKETATIMMRLSFPNPDRVLVPNAYVTLLSDYKTPPSYPAVPQTAVVDLPGGNVGVYLVKDDGTVEATAVETLPQHDGWVPVTKGLKVGQRVVASGTRKLANGTKVVEAKPTSNEENDPNYKPSKF